MSCFGAVFGRKGDGGFSGPLLGACSGDGGFMLACISGCRGVIGCKVATGGVLRAKKFALLDHNTPNSAFLRLLGEFFRGNAAGGATLGELCRANWPCAGLGYSAAHFRLAATGVCAMRSSLTACRSFGWRQSPRLVAVISQFAVVSWPNCRPIR